MQQKTPLGWAIIGKPAPSTRPLKNTASFKNKATSQILPHSNTVLKTTTTPASTPYSTSNKKPSYAQITKRKRRSISPNDGVDVDLLNTKAQAYIQQYAAEEDQLATIIQGNKEEELPGYTQDEIMFLTDVINGTKIRPDNMIELPLPFKQTTPTFAYNRNLAFKRTTNTLETMRRN